MKRLALVAVAAAFVLFGAGQRGPAAETSPAYGFSQRGGATQFTGLPVNPEFYTVLGEYGVLRFGVSTKEMTLECYDEGTNTTVLRNLQDRLAGVVAWNSERLLEGTQPAPVVVTGVFDLRESTVLVTDIQIPRVGEADDGEAVVWDRFDPNSGDEPLLYERNYQYYEPTFYEPYGAYPPAVIVLPVVNNYYVAPDYDRYRYYPSLGGYYDYSRTSPAHRPPDRYPRHHRSSTSRTRSSGSALAGSTISYPRLAMPRAERWGEARQIARKFTNSMAAWSWTRYLNPSQLEKAETRRDGGRHGRHSGGDSHGYRGR